MQLPAPLCQLGPLLLWRGRQRRKVRAQRSKLLHRLRPVDGAQSIPELIIAQAASREVLPDLVRRALALLIGNSQISVVSHRR